MKSRLMLAACLLSASVAGAAETAGTNLATPYPSSPCGPRPVRPVQTGNTPADVTAYNVRVNAYNEAVDKYVPCIRSYVDNANNDLEQIRDKVRAAQEPARP